MYIYIYICMYVYIYIYMYIYIYIVPLNLHLLVYIEFECFPCCLCYNRFCTYFRCDDATYPGSHSGTATAGCNGRCGESTIIFLQYVLTRSDRHICKTVMQQTSFHKINLGKKTLHVIIIVKTWNNECLSMLFFFHSIFDPKCPD